LHKAISDRFKAVPLSIFVALLCLAGWSASARAQQSGEYGRLQSFGISTSYSPDSSHILIGMSEQRRTWFAGFEYTRRIGSTRHVRWDYEGSILPFYLESDPTLIGTEVTVGSKTFTTSQAPQRLVAVPRGPVGTDTTGNGAPVPVYAIPVYAILGRENTYAGGLAPLGARATWFRQYRIQPSFAVDLGFIVSPRDIPIDDTDRFNFMFCFGPGVQIFSNAHSSLRLEYLYHHISNGHLGAENPGVDQGVFRLTLSRHR
jgi:hypothetical protein